MERLENKPVLLFDGDCGLCQRSVKILLAIDRKASFYFAPLEGQTAKLLQADYPLPWPDSLAVYRNDQLFFKTAAVQQCLLEIGGFWHIAAAILSIIPAFISNNLYDLVARNRKKIFQPDCPVPAPGTSLRFLP